MKKQILLIAIALAFFALVAFVLIAKKPQAQTKDPEQLVSAVATSALDVGDFHAQISSRGELTAQNLMLLSAEVSGKIIFLADKLENGERFAIGELIVRFEDSAYSRAQALAESQLAEAKLALELEQTRAAQAKRDWQKLAKNRKPSALNLRQPQLYAAEQKLAAAKADLAHAEFELSKCQIFAPADIIIKQRMVEDGAFVAAGTPLAECFSATAFEVRLPLALADFAMLDLAKDNKIILHSESSADDTQWQGKIIRTESEVNRQSGTIFVVAQVENNTDELLRPGLFVNAKLQSKQLTDVVRIPRTAVYDDNFVVLVDENSQIRKFSLEKIFSDAEFFYAKNNFSTAKYRLCLTQLPAIIEGSKVVDVSQKAE